MKKTIKKGYIMNKSYITRENNRSVKHFLSHFMLLLFLGALLAPRAQAQEIDYGVKAGLNITDYHNVSFNADPLTTFRVGAFANVQLPLAPLSVQPEVHYVREGADSFFQSGDIIHDGPLKTGYIKVPLLLKYALDLPLPVTPELYAGPSASFLVSSDFRGTSGLEEATRDVVYGMAAGMEINLPVISDRVSLEARISRGFNEIYKSGYNPEGGGAFSRPQKHTAFSLILGVEL